jgi:serine/threonine-protein kinase RsbW
MRRLFEKFDDYDDSEFDIEIAVREALSNAIIHGNDQDPRKRVYITCAFSMDGDVSITIRDEGQRLDISAVSDPTNQQDPLVNKGGGIHLMQALMDTVSFEEKGTVVRMRKRLRRAPLEARRRAS